MSMTAYVVAFGLATFSVSVADVATLSASKDGTLYQDATGALANGAGERFFAGRTDEATLRRAVIAFNIAASVPAGSIITNVVMTLYMSRTQAAAQNITVHRVLANWGEGTSDAKAQEGKGIAPTTNDATWIHRFYNTLFWSTAGGDFNATAGATQSVNAVGYYAWSSAGMAADAQLWLDNPVANFGWLLKGNETVNKTAKRFESRESGTPSLRPVLTVYYVPPAGTGACCFGDGTCIVTTSANCSVSGGTFQGNGTSCSPNPCFVPTGACCFVNGTCSELTQAACSASGGTYQGDGVACTPTLCPVILTPFLDPLPLPAVAVPTNGVAGGTAYYEIAMRQFTQQLHNQLPPTTCWGFGGTYPGPTIEARRYEPVTVKWINDLRDQSGNLRTNHFLPVDLCPHGPDTEGDAPRTVVHLHGGHVAPDSDGYPEATFLPGQSATYYYPNLQLPATLWYHDHALGITRLNVMMGLAGFYLIRDAVEDALGLPAGEFEVPLVIQDRTFNADGSFRYPAVWDEHFFGDKILVNGKVWPYLNVKKGKYRFRLLNGSNSRTYTLSFSGNPVFHQIGTDGGLLPGPVPLTSLTIAPGERADIVVDFAGYATGTEILLNNSAPAPFPGPPGAGVIPNVMKFLVTATTGHTALLPPALRPIEVLDTNSVAQVRDLSLKKQSDPCAVSMWMINDLRWDDITEFPVLDTAEIWRFINRSGTIHPMHMHLVMFQVLDRQPFELVGETIVTTGPPVPPPASETGWKDTVAAMPFEITRVIARFETFTGKFPYHCHILEHEDHEMMRQFEVLPPPRIEGIELAGADVVLRFYATSNRFHLVEQRNLLTSGTWSVLTNNVLGAGNVLSITHEGAATLPYQFYRVGLQP